MARTIHYEVSDEEEAAVAEAIAPYRRVSEKPELLSLLYDIDLLPEQIAHMANAMRMIAICVLMQQRDEAREALKRGDNGEAHGTGSRADQPRSPTTPAQASEGAAQ